MLDFSKKVFDYLREVKSDYLLMDMGCMRYELYYPNVVQNKNWGDTYRKI